MKIDRDGVSLHVREDGVSDGPPIVFANSLATNLHLWDGIIPHLPDGLRLIRYDMRGHGESDMPDAPYTMGQLVGDAEAVCDALNVRDCVFVGLSVGGMVAQGLAIKRPDIMRAMVLSNTAAKIGTKTMWQDRIDTATTAGMSALVDATMQRWFGRQAEDRDLIAPWAAMFTATPPEGYAGISAAIAGTDFYTPTSGLRLPTLGIAGSEDGATPTDLVRETVDLIPGSQFALMRQAGHLPCASHPEEYATLISTFLENTGHI